MSNKEKWQEICEREPSVPIFLHTWWLDIVCGKDSWHVILSFSSKGTINGALTYFIKKRWGLSIITVPPYTPMSGIWFRQIDTDKTHSYHSTRKKIMTEIIGLLPKTSLLDLKLHYSNDNWLPFKWNGFKTSVNYTHTIDLKQSEDEIWDAFKGSTRSKIQKTKDQIDIEPMNSLNSVMPFIKSIFDYKRFRHKVQLMDLLLSLDDELVKREQRKIWVARNSQGEIEAYLYLIWDKHSAYYLVGGTSATNRKSNAMYGLFWEAIKYSKKQVNIFDFEGSIIPDIERVFKSFGAIPRPYFNIYKSGSKLMEIARIIMGKNG